VARGCSVANVAAARAVTNKAKAKKSVMAATPTVAPPPPTDHDPRTSKGYPAARQSVRISGRISSLVRTSLSVSAKGSGSIGEEDDDDDEG